MIHVLPTYLDAEHKVIGSLRILVNEVDGVESIQHFAEMVRRALNCWPDAHPELKELGDMLMHGRILQDYYAHRTDIKKK